MQCPLECVQIFQYVPFQSVSYHKYVTKQTTYYILVVLDESKRKVSKINIPSTN